MITENMGLVYMVAKRFANRGTDLQDLTQIGVIGLIKAIDRFDTSLSYSFSTYAVPLIMGEIRRFLRDDGMIHTSRQMKEHARKIAIVREQMKRHKIRSRHCRSWRKRQELLLKIWWWQWKQEERLILFTTGDGK